MEAFRKYGMWVSVLCVVGMFTLAQLDRFKIWEVDFWSRLLMLFLSGIVFLWVGVVTWHDWKRHRR